MIWCNIVNYNYNSFGKIKGLVSHHSLNWIWFKKNLPLLRVASLFI